MKMVKMKDCCFFAPPPPFFFFALYESPKQHPKEENNHFVLTGHLATQPKAKLWYTLSNMTCAPERGGWRTPLTTGSGRPRWPDYGPSCNPRLQRPSRRRQPAGQWPGPACRQGCPPTSAAPAAAGPWSGWAACRRCPCNEHTHQKFRTGFSPGGKAALYRCSRCSLGRKIWNSTTETRKSDLLCLCWKSWRKLQ